MKCFYHSADLDGHCSGAIIKKFHPEAELVGYNYGKEFPWESIEPGETVFMVDVSLLVNDMARLSTDANLIWIDHHVRIIEEVAEVGFRINGLQRTDRAACELCWEYCSDAPVPQAVALLGIYDSWRFTPEQEPKIKQFQYGMRFEKETRPEKVMEFWTSLFSSSPLNGFLYAIGERGQTIYEYQLTQNEKTCRSCAFETELGINERDARSTLRCIAVNSGLLADELLKSVYDPERHDAMLVFYRSNRGFWKCSLRTDNPEVNCAIFAKAFGGGGHKGAAGFQCLELPFELTKMD